MCNKVKLEDIKKIPKEEFKDIMQGWINQKEVMKDLQKKLRKQLFSDFQKTAMGKAMEAESLKKSFNPKAYVLNSMHAEHLYCEKYFFTLSVLSAEIQPYILPNFENEKFRYETKEILEYLQILGLHKEDKIVKQITTKYKSSNESLISLLLKHLILNHRVVESKTSGAQTETRATQVMDDSQISCSSKSHAKRVGRRRNHSLLDTDIRSKSRKSTKSGVSLIAKNLDKMSLNISMITDKLEGFKKSSSHDDTKPIISYVGSIMQQLSSCVNNFEKLCNDIKAINEGKNRNYKEYIDDMKNSDNGRKFLKKFSKSFYRILNEEKKKIQKDYQGKLEKEKKKLYKFHHKTLTKAKPVDKTPTLKEPLDTEITKDLNEIYRNAFLTIENMEKENQILEKTLEIDIMNRRKGAQQNVKKIKTKRKENQKPESNVAENNLLTKLDLNECRQIHSAESSSINDNEPHSYSITSFEDDISDDKNI